MFFIGPISSVFDYATFFLMWYVFDCRNFMNPATTDASRSYFEHLFHSGWFVESLITQTLIVHIIRTRKIPFVQSWPSPMLLFTTLCVIAAAVWLPYSPLATWLGMVPLPLSYWIWITGFMVVYAVATHRVKVWFYNRYGLE